MLDHTPLIETIVTGLVAAFVAGALAQRLRLSPIVGYLLAGVLVGPYTPGIVSDQALAAELAEIGVILLMFDVGLHFSLGDLMAVRWIAIPGAVIQIAVATGLGLGLGALIGWSTGAGVLFGLALSVASTVVLLRALEQRRLIDTTRGKIAVGWLIVEDIAMILALVLLPALAGAPGDDGQATSPWLALVLTFGKIGAFIASMLLVARRAIPWLLERVAGIASREMFTLCVLAIALGVAFGSARMFDVSFALGAFFAGMLLNESEYSQMAARDALPLRDAFAVLFFVSVGMLLDPAIFIEAPWLILGTLAIIIAGKALAALAIVLVLGHPFRTALTVAVSLTQIGEFSFILAELGVELQLLPTTGRDLILAGAIVSILCNPLLFAVHDRWISRHQAGPPNGHLEPPVGRFVLVIGFGRVGLVIAEILRERGAPLRVIDIDGDVVARARAAGIPAVAGNGADPRVLAEVGLDHARIALIAIPRALEAGEIAAHLRAARPDLSIIARGHSDAEVQHLLRRGADGAVMAERVLAQRMADMAATSMTHHDRIRPPLAG